MLVTWKAWFAKPYPSCLHTTMASMIPQLSLHTAPHTVEPFLSASTSTRPSYGFLPPLRRSCKANKHPRLAFTQCCAILNVGQFSSLSKRISGVHSVKSCSKLQQCNQRSALTVWIHEWVSRWSGESRFCFITGFKSRAKFLAHDFSSQEGARLWSNIVGMNYRLETGW